jgi:hypothetical protein
MIWLLAATYLLAGVTIARMAYEFDVFAEPGASLAEQARIREREIWTCVMLVFVWPFVPALLLWSYVRMPRR